MIPEGGRYYHILTCSSVKHGNRLALDRTRVLMFLKSSSDWKRDTLKPVVQDLAESLVAAWIDIARLNSIPPCFFGLIASLPLDVTYAGQRSSHVNLRMLRMHPNKRQEADENNPWPTSGEDIRINM